VASVVRKKLIEVSIPLEAINAASAREKSIRHGHPSTLHLWWARRPLAACRAVLFAQLVDDPSAWPDRYPFPEIANTEDGERKRMHRIIERMVPWEASNDERILNEARWEIARSVRGVWAKSRHRLVTDQRSSIISRPRRRRSTIRFAVAAQSRSKRSASASRLWLGPQPRCGIDQQGAGRDPAEIRRGATGESGRRAKSWRHMERQRRARPRRRCALLRAVDARRGGAAYRASLSEGAAARRFGGNGHRLAVGAHGALARPADPRAKGAMVPLVSSFLLSAKEGKKAWVEPVNDPAAPDAYRFEVRRGKLSKADEDRLRKGTKTGRGTFTCFITGSPILNAHIKAEARAQRLGQRLMAVICEAPRGRAYFAASTEQEVAAAVSRPDIPDVAQAIANDPRALTPILYDLDRFDKLFTPRQLVALSTFSDLVGESREKALTDALAAGLKTDSAALHAGGAGAVAYVDAVATYLALAVDRSVMRGNSLEKVFGRVQSPWLPATGDETYEIIRRRMFQALDADGERARNDTVRAFHDLYRKNPPSFHRKPRRLAIRSCCGFPARSIPSCSTDCRRIGRASKNFSGPVACCALWRMSSAYFGKHRFTIH
jgi:putative DNA methylase